MAGHSHWARIKRAKAVTDARRGKSWSKLSRAIIVAARIGGGDPDANLSLRYAIDAAKAENMPKDTIERAIKKGAGGGAETQYHEMLFEGRGPGGVAILATGLSDNRNRTGPEIRNLFENHGGKLDSVAYMFAKRGVFSVAKSATDEDTLTGIALDTGADDVKSEADGYELTCDPAVFETVKAALAAAKIATESAEITMVASTSVMLTGEKAQKAMALVDLLEEHDDIQKVYTNAEFDEAEMAKISGA